MIYRLKNNSDSDFSFEGVFIKARGISDEVSPEIYQRLLAIYWNNPLLPVDENDPDLAEKIEEDIKKDEDNSEQEQNVQDEPIEKIESEVINDENLKSFETEFYCNKCGKKFKNEKGLSFHNLKVHK
jgi:hypothetical protein